MVSSDWDTIEMENLDFLSQTITIEVDITVLACIQRCDKEFFILFGNKRVIFSDTHSTNLDIVWRLGSSFTDFSLFLIDFVINSSTQLGVLIKVR